MMMKERSWRKRSTPAVEISDWEAHILFRVAIEEEEEEERREK